MVDEGSFGSTAKTLLEKGYLGTTLVRGLNSHVYWQPPVYFLALAPVIKIGGYSLVTLRVFSVLVACSIVAMVFVLGLRLASPMAAKVAALVLVCDPKFVNTAMYARMDGMCTLFMLVVLALLVKPLFKSVSANALTVGVFAAFASLTHPLGLIAPVITAISMVGQTSLGWRERMKRMALMLLPLCAGAILWGLYILQDTNGFVHQFGFQLARKHRPLLATFTSVLNHYRAYPLSLGIPFIGLGLIAPSALRERGNLLLTTIFQAAILVAAIVSFEIPYHVYFAPLSALIAGMILARVWKGNNRIAHASAAAFASGIALNAVLVFGYLNIVHYFSLVRETDYDRFCADVSSHLPLGSTVYSLGTPCLYWGLYTQRPDIAVRDLVAFDTISTSEGVKEINYVVLTRAFKPEDDEIAFGNWHSWLSRLFSANDLELKHIETVGTVTRFAYSAEMLAAIPRYADSNRPGSKTPAEIHR